MTEFAQKLKDYGVVGAGGAGFPTYVKAQSRVEYLLANGAECEPLLHKDFELMKHFAGEIVEGMRLMQQATGARHGRMGVKEKNKEAIEALRPHVERARYQFTLLGDFYPSGDEYEVVYAATGRLIPAAGIPLQVGCVVNNVETLYNVWLAEQGRPVTQKFVSICGAVRNPKSFWAPVGVSFRELIEMAGGPTVADYAMFVSGIMMGQLSRDPEDVVTKTTAGLIVLPADHYLVVRKGQPQTAMNRIGKSACDQCSYCTEFCPRYLLGYDVQPHKVMRTLGFTYSGSAQWNQFAELCCACGLCTLYACPEDLFPKEACDQAKADMRAAGMKYVQQKPVTVHPMKEYRRVPQAMLRKRLKVDAYEAATPFEDVRFAPRRVRIKLQQHAGKPARPVVSEGQRVEQGALLAAVGASELGAAIHASISGVVEKITDTFVEIHA